MVTAVRMPSLALRAAVAAAAIAGLAGCGSSFQPTPVAHAGDASETAPLNPKGECASTVVHALGDIAMRVYHEGVASARTASAESLITNSPALRQAIEQDDPLAARAAGQALLATHHMTNLRVLVGSQTLVDVGGPDALAPLHGTIDGVHGAPIASFLASVWADRGFITETNGIAEGGTALRDGTTSIAGSFPLPPGELPPEGVLTERGVSYRYTSFPVLAYPAGLRRVYLLRSIQSTAPLCGHTEDDTLVNTLSHIATLIYEGEAGRRTLTQIHRVQNNQALLRAVAKRDPAGTDAAVKALLHEHIVRLRVLSGGQLLSDVGGPFVLAPVTAPLRFNGHTIGSFVLSIQDDLGYRLLAQRLAGLDVVMSVGSRVVMSSFNPPPSHTPPSGPYRYAGHSYRVFSFTGRAFPSAPLKITVLIPIPYS
jgi:hypothetical protein